MNLQKICKIVKVIYNIRVWQKIKIKQKSI